MNEWFEDWFNTAEYLNVYQHRNEVDAKKLVDLILANVNLPEKATVLDMACGAGRHSILFAQKGYDVTAVDLSESLLTVARSLAKDFGLNINFIKSDLRDFKSNQNFNLAVNLFTSFGYFETDEDNFKVFKIAYNQLVKSGYFVLDYLNKDFIEKNLIKKSIEQIEGGEIIQNRKIENNRVIKEITISRNGEQKHFLESVRMYEKEELLTALNNLGFEIVNIFGDFKGNHFNSDLSQRIIIISQK